MTPDPRELVHGPAGGCSCGVAGQCSEHGEQEEEGEWVREQRWGERCRIAERGNDQPDDARRPTNDTALGKIADGRGIRHVRHHPTAGPPVLENIGAQVR